MTTHVYLRNLRQFDSKRFVSKVVHDSKNARIALFYLEPEQEVLSHTTTSEVVFLVMEGKGEIFIGEEQVPVEAESLVVCPPQVPHGMKAEQHMVVAAVIAPRPA